MEAHTSKRDTVAADISTPTTQTSEETKQQFSFSNAAYRKFKNFSESRKVQELFRKKEHNKRDYDPVAVSFGPYHHGKPEHKFVEDFKPTALELYAAGTGKRVDFFYNKVVEVIDEVMDMDMSVGFTFMGHLGMLVYSIIFRDLILLENQIPFWFLKFLVCLKFDKDEGEEKVRRFLVSCLTDGEYEQTKDNNNQQEPLHLLEACRRVLVAHRLITAKILEPNQAVVFVFQNLRVFGRGKQSLPDWLSKDIFTLFLQSQI